MKRNDPLPRTNRTPAKVDGINFGSGENRMETTNNNVITPSAKANSTPTAAALNARGVRQRNAKNTLVINSSPSPASTPTLSPSSSAILSTPTHRSSLQGGTTPLSKISFGHDSENYVNQRRWRGSWEFLRPRKWNLGTLLILILVVSTVCSFFMSTISLWWWWSSALDISHDKDTHGIPQLRKNTDQHQQALQSNGNALSWKWWSGNNQKGYTFSSRVHYLAGFWDGTIPSETSFQVDETMMHSLRNEENDKFDDWQPIDYTNSRCKPLAQWQTQSFPTCNNLHELQLHAALPEAFKHSMNLEEELTVLGEGWFRTTWRLDRKSVDGRIHSESLVLKTLRIEREYKREYYELHRRDAVAMERLTQSPFVVDVYGACGNSAINELANFPYEGVQSLEVFNRRLRGHDQNPEVYLMKLRMAASVAVGLAHVHGIDSKTVPTLAHYDINPRNIALFEGGKPKLNDFNIAEFLHYDPETGEGCGFPARLHEPWWRAPEEMNVTTHEILVDEKVDVYALGNILFHTLTTHSPRGKMKPERVNEVRSLVASGIPPVIPPPYDNSTDPAAIALRHAMTLCYKADPQDRGTAAEVAEYLTKALFQLTQHEDEKKKEKHHNKKKEVPHEEAIPDTDHASTQKSEDNDDEDE